MIFHVHMLLTCRIYLNHDSDCDRFCMSISGSVIFGKGGRFNMYNIGSGLEKCYIVLHRVGGWSKNTIFLRYTIREQGGSIAEWLACWIQAQ